MNAILLKRARVRLDSEAYAQLYRQVLDRDGWECQSCGRSSQLQDHHQRFRSALGDDSLENLIALCAFCNTSTHIEAARIEASRA
jgi:5-methylcytosine-specific restriction endonuclease McrA